MKVLQAQFKNIVAALSLGLISIASFAQSPAKPAPPVQQYTAPPVQQYQPAPPVQQQPAPPVQQQPAPPRR